MIDAASAKAPPLRPTDLAAALDCSVPYASQMLGGTRKVTVSRALLIFDRTGHKIGPIASATDAEIKMLRRFAEAA